MSRNNGRFTAVEEDKAMGCEMGIYTAMDKSLLIPNRNIEFPGHSHMFTYDSAKLEPLMEDVVKDAGVNLMLMNKVVEVETSGNKIVSVTAESTPPKFPSARQPGKTARTKIEGEAFVDATGGAGGLGNCRKYGLGCSCCVYRCPTFGDRVSLAEKAGAKEIMALGGPNATLKDGPFGRTWGGMMYEEHTIDQKLLKEIREKGALVYHPSKETVEKNRAFWSKIIKEKSCQQYSHTDESGKEEYVENIIMIYHTGSILVLVPYWPGGIQQIRQTIPEFGRVNMHEARFAGIVPTRWMAICPTESKNTLRAESVANLFVAGEKAGFVGHDDAVVTGHLAGHNAARTAMGKKLLEVPGSIAIGVSLNYVRNAVKNKDGFKEVVTYSGLGLFEKMKQLGLHTTDTSQIKERVKKAGLAEIYPKSIS